jgi:hypothetical protein
MCIICVLIRASPILRPREVANWGECVSFGSQVNSDERLFTDRNFGVVVPVLYQDLVFLWCLYFIYLLLNIL